MERTAIVDGTKKLDIVFCLDLSGSTNGLIKDVKEGYWHIINQMNLMEPRPKFRLGLVGFSRPSYTRENAYVKVLSLLTNDFDYLSFVLYKIRPAVEEGEQYVGSAINTCVTRINWDTDKETKKIIFIIGNGIVGVSNKDFIKACQLAIQQKILINSVYVMGRSDKARELPGWYKIANIAHGIATEIAIGKTGIPYGKEFDYNSLKLASESLNKTYIYYGADGNNKYNYFHSADSAALTGDQSLFVERVYYKNSSLFKGANENWDFVDYLKSNGMLPPMNDTLTMPDSLRMMSEEEILDLVQRQKAARERISKNIDYIFKDNSPVNFHQQYASGLFKEENSFSRSVMLLLLKQWN